MFVLRGDGAILHENEPGLPPGPKLCWMEGAGARVVRLRHDITQADTIRLRNIIAAAPRWSDVQVDPARLGEALDILGGEVSRSLVYRLPGDVPPRPGAFVRSGTAQGDALLARIAAEGVPPHLHDAGFVGLEDFWAPWYVALEDGQIAAMAFAARLGPAAAEIGVYTFPAWRGRGLAAAVTAAWSAHPDLAGRDLFYSTHTSNLSSQRVAARLGLSRIAHGLRIS